MPEINQQALLTTNGNAGIQLLYAKYSAMLLGYLIEIIKDRRLAEDYLIKIFCELAKTRFHNDNEARIISWNELRKFAINILPASGNPNGSERLSDQTGNSGDLTKPGAEHQFVFNSVYYHGKSIATVAAKLDRTEEAVRRILKEAFTAMKGNREN